MTNINIEHKHKLNYLSVLQNRYNNRCKYVYKSDREFYNEHFNFKVQNSHRRVWNYCYIITIEVKFRKIIKIWTVKNNISL
jgi:hypothetical protein